jgi:hypothetical protein
MMNDQNQDTPPDSNSPKPVYSDWREQRHAERLAHRQVHTARPNAWISGIFLILLGLVVLFRNMGVAFLANWWALFILIPAYAAFIAAWEKYQANGRLTRSSAASLMVGILLTLVTLVFLFNVALGQTWPILLILGGLALMGTALWPE